MTITGKPVTTLPEAESVTNADYILIFSNGALMRAPGTLFRGDDATINGVNALTIEAGDNISLSQDGGTLTLSANISGVFIFKGPATLATLPPLTAASLGFTYNMTQSFTTTSDFIEGAGKEYSAGADVAVCDAGNGVYKYNVLSIDLSGLVPKTRKINGHSLSADVTLGKSDVGLGNVDNTADANKPVSTAQQAALDAKQDKLPATGAANRGVYVSAAGVVSQMSHTLDKDVPANAVFTDTNTTYTLTQDASDGHKLTFASSEGASVTVTIPDNDTTYDAATAAPLMDGTAAVGTSAAYARGDHVHPMDTSRASAADVTDLQTDMSDAQDAISALQAENAVLRNLIEHVDAPIYFTAFGNPATFSDAAAANVKELTVTLTPSQSAAPSVESPVPIIGYSSVTVTRQRAPGRNLLTNWHFPTATLDANGVPVGWTLNSAISASELDLNNNGLTIYAPDRASGTYAVTQGISAALAKYPNETITYSALYWNNGALTFDSTSYVNVFPLTHEWEQDGPQLIGYNMLCNFDLYARSMRIYGRNPGTEAIRIVAVKAEPGTEQTLAYQDSAGNWTLYETPADVSSVTVPLVDSNNNDAALTVYGGVLTLTPSAATLTVTHGNIPSYDGESAVPDGWISSTGELSAGAQVVYPLDPADYQTYPLTPAQLATLSGCNAVFADAGTLSVTYRADPSLSLGGAT